MPRAALRMRRIRQIRDAVIDRLLLEIDGRGNRGSHAGGGMMSSGSGGVTVLLKEAGPHQRRGGGLIGIRRRICPARSAQGSSMDISAMGGSGAGGHRRGDDMDLHGPSPRIL